MPNSPDIIQTQVNSFNPAFSSGRLTSVNPIRSLASPFGSWRADPDNPPYAGNFCFCDYDTGYAGSVPSGGENVKVGFVLQDNTVFLGVDRANMRLAPGFAMGVIENADVAAAFPKTAPTVGVKVLASLYDGSAIVEADAAPVTASAAITDALLTVTGNTSANGTNASLPVGSTVTGDNVPTNLRIISNNGDGTYNLSAVLTGALAVQTMTFSTAAATNATTFTPSSNGMAAISLIGAAPNV